MKIYLGAPWVHRALARQIAGQFRQHGHTIVSRWHDEWGAKTDTGLTDADKQDEAEKDVADVIASDVVVQMNWEGSTGGMFVEHGVALARRIPVIVVGKRTNVFHYLNSVFVVPGFFRALDILKMLEEGI